MAMLQQSQDKLLEQQKALAVRRYTIGTSTDDNTTPNIPEIEVMKKTLLLFR